MTIVIFGGGGDLAHRKLLPALYNLHVDGLLPPKTAIVGVGRSAMTDDAYREFAKDGVERFSRRPIDEEAWHAFADALFFVAVSIEDPKGFASLGARLDIIEHERGLSGNRIYYLAIPPSLFVPTVKQGLARARLVGKTAISPSARVIVEKPLGHDLESACAINDAIAKVFDEKAIYRIDHYLGKETVQNILVLRFANSFFEPLFNQKHIDHVQITVAEAEGVGTRAGYYEQAGALRDMVQNHLLQLLAVIAMEAPRSLEADAIRDEKLQVLLSLRKMDAATRSTPTPSAPNTPATAARPRRRRRFADRNVRRPSAVHRQLALGWRPVLPAHREEASQPSERDRGVSEGSAADPLQQQPRRSSTSERALDSYSAGRGLLARDQFQGAGPAREGRTGQDGFPLRRAVRKCISGGVRAPAARRHGGRSDPVHAARRGRSRLALGDADPRALDDEDRRTAGDIWARHLGTARRRCV